MSNPQRAYDQLLTELREINLLNSINYLLGWDERVMLPPAGADHRANQMSLIARLHHERFASPRIGDLLKEVEASSLVQDRHSDAGAQVFDARDRKSTRLNSSHTVISYAVFCLKKKKTNQIKKLIRNVRNARLQRIFKKSFTSFRHSTRNKTIDGFISVRIIKALYVR